MDRAATSKGISHESHHHRLERDRRRGPYLRSLRRRAGGRRGRNEMVYVWLYRYPPSTLLPTLTEAGSDHNIDPTSLEDCKWSYILCDGLVLIANSSLPMPMRSRRLLKSMAVNMEWAKATHPWALWPTSG